MTVPNRDDRMEIMQTPSLIAGRRRSPLSAKWHAARTTFAVEITIYTAAMVMRVFLP